MTPHVHIIYFSWKRPRLTEAGELSRGARLVTEGRDAFLGEFRQQLQFKPPRMKYPGAGWLKSRRNEFLRIIEPFDLVLWVGMFFGIGAFVWISDGPMTAKLAAIFLGSFGLVWLLYFGSLYLAFRKYRRWLDEMEQKYRVAGSGRDG
jgi:hypothetical protein